MRFEMTLNKRMLPAAMLALALMGLHPGSQAGTITTQHGSKCKPYGVSHDSRAYPPAFKAVNGLWSYYTNAAMHVVCPVTRVGSPTSGGLRVWIDGYAPSGWSLTCELTSVNYDGSPIGYASFTMTGTGYNFDKYLDLAPASVPMYSSQGVMCHLPPGGGIYDIEPESLGS